MTEIRPGDVLVVRDRTFWARAIRWGGAIGDSPNVWNHVVVASHHDDAGTFWGVEGRPGGTGWVDIRARLDDRWTISSADQPKTDEQRAHIATVAAGMVGRPYDWAAIVRDAMDALSIDTLWRLPDWDGRAGAPAHVVCSSLASYVYRECGLAAPTGTHGAGGRWATPYDWAAWILRRAWAA
jgi:hypothetical protein